MAKMTATLLQSYDYYLKVPTSRSLDQIYNTLTKAFTGSTATIRGEKYEDYVNKKLILKEDFDLPMEQEAYEQLRGSAQQMWINPLMVHTSVADFVFRGKTDYIKGDWVYDLKTSKKFDEQSYHEKWQHTIYALAMGKPNFKYIVAQFDDDSGLKPIAIHEVVPTIATLEDLTSHVEECAKFLEKHFKEEFYAWAGIADKPKARPENTVVF